ncbi:MAG: hypothetical protein M1365_09650 [Actinobacteria bacterium]|nr:hypothetical protein [Actinomycetota bacterium]
MQNFEVLIEEDKLENIVSLKEAIKRLKESDNISAFSIQCWTSLNEIYGIVPCLANSLLFDEGIPVVCESDICGSVSALIAQSASFGQNKVIFADITNRHPENDNGELLWHCGPFPTSLKKKDLKGKILCHSILNNAPAGICSFEIEGGDISILRFDGLGGNYSLLAGHAHGIEGPETVGTVLWVEVKDWTKWEERLIYGPYIHHVAAVHGKISPVLYEAVRYIKGLILDAIDPDEDEIRDYLTGRSDSL